MDDTQMLERIDTTLHQLISVVRAINDNIRVSNRVQMTQTILLLQRENESFEDAMESYIQKVQTLDHRLSDKGGR